MSSHVPLSVLELVPVSAGMTHQEAFGHSVELAQLVDSLDYERFWVAEHHGSDTFLSTATSLVLGHLADRTTRIRLGSGGVMLPNHAPLMVAEYYGTLATLYGDRFDLGLGRAPGTDPMTAAALRRGDSELDTFADDVAALRRYLGEPRERGVRAIPGQGTNVPLWMLGSSTGGAQVAAALGLPFSFASHFAPAQLDEALTLYRQHFQPSPQCEQPRVMAGVQVLVAPEQAEAEYLYSTTQLMRIRLRTGQLAPLDPPVRDLSTAVPEQLLPYAGEPNSVASMVGTPDRVVSQLERFVTDHQVDELIVATYTFDPALRQRSYQLLADAWF